MIGPLDSPNLTLLLTDQKGRPLPADDALDRAAALRQELRAADFVLSATPATAPAQSHLPLAAGGRGPAEAITLGAVATAVLPPMVPALIEFLRGWGQRNQGVRIRLAVAGDADGAVFDPSKMGAKAIKALVERLQARLVGERIRTPVGARQTSSAA
ncbi:MAG: hypothetical protein LJE69_07050 [Thiohalocapsa sp.]|jgi:hypothetical protein|uniref:hypothetical protein n=1 Tax=Thiohalocapsa sp. TaxID=2497641 RepID=UPI0025F90A5F|nr:hypothetical protein [Thiohalocapsa sp.]MCG6940991.1 hypothetical protein [Thiohalocapsa sp.]